MCNTNKTDKSPHLAALCCLLMIAISLVLTGCGGGGVSDLSYTNPDWRDSVVKTVEFPLPEPVELRVGTTSGITSDSAGVKWIAEATNIVLKMEPIPSSPADIELGQMVRRGELYDILPGGRLSIGDEAVREMLVDFREFGELLPNVRSLVDRDPNYRAGLAANITSGGQLFTLGTYDPDRPAYKGALVYRRDLFEKHGLAFGTWDELVDSLRKLKTLYPNSAPLGGNSEDIYYTYPALFGTGLDRDSVIYYDPDRRDWIFGPSEPEFERYVRIIADLYAEGILLPEILSSPRNEYQRLFASNTVFVAPYLGITGLNFSFMGPEYGRLDENGAWDGTGIWVEPMPLPSTEGKAGRVTSSLYSYVDAGWNIYNQSEHVGEAIALLDFLFDRDNALRAGYGPPGTLWDYVGDGVSLLGNYKEVYENKGVEALADLAAEAGITIGSPVPGLRFAVPASFFGRPTYPAYRFFVETDVATNPAGEAFAVNPGLSVSKETDFDYDRAGLVVSLSTFIEGNVARFILGQRSLDEFEDFVAECRKQGADRLLELYRNNSNLFTGDIF